MTQKAYNPDAFWFSKLEVYRTCPRLYEAKFIDKVVIDDKGLDTEFGTALHLALNDILLGGDGEEIFKMYWDSVDENLKRFKFDKKALGFNASVLLPRFARLHAKKFKPFKMEERMFSQFGEHQVEGTPDFLGDFEGIPSIVDFKTSSAKYDTKKILCEEQLSGYAAMAAKEFGYVAKQRVYVVFIKDFKEPSIQIIKSELTEDYMYSTVDNVTSTIDQIKEDTRFVRNTKNCISGPIVCPNFSACWGKKEENE